MRSGSLDTATRQTAEVLWNWLVDASGPEFGQLLTKYANDLETMPGLYQLLLANEYDHGGGGRSILGRLARPSAGIDRAAWVQRFIKADSAPSVTPQKRDAFWFRVLRTAMHGSQDQAKNRKVVELLKTHAGPEVVAKEAKFHRHPATATHDSRGRPRHDGFPRPRRSSSQAPQV